MNEYCIVILVNLSFFLILKLQLEAKPFFDVQDCAKRLILHAEVECLLLTHKVCLRNVCVTSAGKKLPSSGSYPVRIVN